ncbi:ABC transporter transmembrane domain-containing protein [Faecalimicrobium sp. JNUCC 81]
MNILKFCKKYTNKYKYTMYIYLLSGVISSFILVVLPYLMGKFIDILIISKNISVLIWYCILFVSLNIIKSILSYISKLSYAKIQTKSAYDLNYSILHHMKELPISFFGDKDSVYLNQRINSDSNSIISFYIDFILNLFTNMLNLVFSIIIAVSIDIKIALILIVLVSIYIYTYKIFKSKIFKATLEFKEKQSNLFSKLNEQLHNVKFIKLHNLNNKFGERLNKSFKALYDKAIYNCKLESLFSFCDEMISSIAQLIIYVIGGIGVINGSITIGILTITINYFNMLLKSIKYFFELGKIYQSNLVSYERIKSLLNIQTQSNGDQILESIEEIKIDNISFKHGDKAIFNQYSVCLEKGKIYTLIGENGAGKSTLIDLILGMYTKEHKGSIYYNNEDIDNLNMKFNREKLISITEQEPMLINDTILNNLILNLENYDEQYLEYLIDILNIRPYFNTLSLGINTIINSTNNISGGEKQKLSIIRSLIKNPDIIILDEPTSALDKSTIISLKDHLSMLKKDKIIIIITHDKSIDSITDEYIEITREKELCHI